MGQLFVIPCEEEERKETQNGEHGGYEGQSRHVAPHGRPGDCEAKRLQDSSAQRLHRKVRQAGVAGRLLVGRREGRRECRRERRWEIIGWRIKFYPRQHWYNIVIRLPRLHA